jgi:hypothetical protein
METKVRFIATGFVLGYLWLGDKGAYGARSLSADTREEIISQAEKGIEDGSLDGGMGFQSLLGALLHITTITTVTIDGKEFENRETEAEIIGELSDKDEDFLNEVAYNF